MNAILLHFLHSHLQTLSKPVIRVLIQSPPSWIAWKKYQLYRATHERMWAMSTTSLSPNMGYVPLSLSLQFILVVLVGENSRSIASHPLQQMEQMSSYQTHSIQTNKRNCLSANLEFYMISYDQFRQYAMTRGPNPHQFPTFAWYELWYYWTYDFEVLVTASWL